MLTQVSVPLLPALLTAGGALVGVVLTLTVQAANSITQRRNERRGRAFEARFELYADFWDCVEGVPEMCKRADAHIAKQTEVADAVRAESRNNEELASLAAAVPSSGDLSELTAEQRQDLQPRARAALDRRKQCEERVAKANKALKLDGESEDLRAQLDQSQRQLYRVRQKMKILSDPDTLVAAVAIFERVANSEEPTAAEQGEFSRAVRRELSLDSPGPLRRLRLWAKWRRQRWRRKRGAARQRPSVDEAASSRQ